MTLNPASRGDFGTISILIGSPISRTTITASSLDELLPKVKEHAENYDVGCSAWISVPNGTRKPPGFDARTSKLFFNLDKQPTEQTA